jgi:ABC-type multidrug transport system fused ATPase/permease subunit
MTWRKRIFRKLVQVPIEVMLTRVTGDQVSRLLVDTGVMSRGYTMLLGRTIGDLLGGIAALAVALMINWRLSLLAMTCLPLVAVMLRKFGKVIRRATRRVLGEQGRMVAAVSESLGALRVVKVHNAEGYERRRFSVINRAIYDQEVRARQVRALANPALKTVTHIAVAGIAVIAAWMTFSKGVEPKEFMTVIAALVAAASSIRPLASLNNQLHESTAAAKRVFDVLDLPVESTADEELDLPPLPRHRESIVFDGVCYTYPNAAEPALRDVSFTTRHGQTVAIVGPNGSGKTTLMSLLPRLVDPSEGRVLIDGTDIATVRRRSLRRQLGIVTQETVLFQGTIADNIAYGSRHAPRDRIEAAARSAYADDFITALADGYDAKLGDGGSGLSGGQRQRLCIARALLRDPAIMILDEATSQIDADSEQKISLALREQRERRTTFVIAHRLSTVIDADLIVVMDGGRIIDLGRHDELVDRCEIYRVLSQTQLKPPRPAEPAVAPLAADPSASRGG